MARRGNILITSLIIGILTFVLPYLAGSLDLYNLDILSAFLIVGVLIASILHLGSFGAYFCIILVNSLIGLLLLWSIEKFSRKDFGYIGEAIIALISVFIIDFAILFLFMRIIPGI
jgi:hypothetical protein